MLHAVPCRKRIAIDSLDINDDDPMSPDPVPKGVDAAGHQASQGEPATDSQSPRPETLALSNPPMVPSRADLERQAKLKEALIVQMEMQKHLHHQLEVGVLSRPSRHCSLDSQLNTSYFSTYVPDKLFTNIHISRKMPFACLC